MNFGSFRPEQVSFAGAKNLFYCIYKLHVYNYIHED